MEKKKICKIREIYRAIAALESLFEKQYDLNINEAMLLCHLKDHADVTSGEIAESLQLTCSNASKVIVSVEKKKLVRRRLDKNDKRQMHFSLTKMGEERLGRMNCDSIELPELLRSITAEQ